jgi:hypothetical protein
MAGSNPGVPALLATCAIIATLGTGCAPAGAGEGKGGARGTPRPTPANGITAERLEGALLTRISGYAPFGRPESGEFGTLKSMRQGSQLQQAATLDKPHCAGVSAVFGADDGRVAKAPAASVVFARALQLTMHELLVVLPPDVAAARVAYRVPKSCRTYRARIGDGEWFTYRVVESGDSARERLGTTSRTVGVSATSGSGGAARRTKIWHVAFQDGGYAGFVTLSGPRATRSDAEELAARAREEAERVIPG